MPGEVYSLAQCTQIIVTPTVSNNVAYSANDQVGGIMTLTAAIADLADSAAELVSVCVTDQTAQSAALTIFFFDSLPTIASSDNVAFDLLDAQMEKCLGHIKVAATDYQTSASNSEATVANCGLIVKCREIDGDRVYSSGKIYAVAKTTGTPTYLSTTALTFRFSFRQ